MTTFAPSTKQFVSRRQFLRITAVSSITAGLFLAGKRRGSPQLTTLRETRTLMGTLINLVVATDDAENGRTAVAATFAEMERLIAVFDHRRADSPLAVLNQNGTLTSPPTELVDVILQANRYSQLTGGAFDISIKPLLDAYQANLPNPLSYRHLVNYQDIQANTQQLTLARPDMALTLDGIAKGRVVDGATAILSAYGFPNVLVEAGGDLMGLGRRADGSPWQIGIAHPRQRDDGLLGAVAVTMQAVATSGDYMHSFSQDLRQHHIIDPRTGKSPADLASVTVLAPTAMDADALSTSVMVLGCTEGVALVERLPHVEALVVTKTMELVQTSGFPDILEE